MTEGGQRGTVRHRSGSVPGYDDFLIGDRLGLERLKAAIDEALESDRGASDAHIGDFFGVQCWSDEDLAESSLASKPVQQALGCSVGLLWLLVMGAGIFAILSWIVSLIT